MWSQGRAPEEVTLRAAPPLEPQILGAGSSWGQCPRQPGLEKRQPTRPPQPAPRGRPAQLPTAPCRPGVALTLGVLVTQGRRPHVAEPQGALAAAVDEEVAVVGVELGGGDHLGEVLHVGRLDVHDVCGQVKEGQRRHPGCSAFPPAPKASRESPFTSVPRTPGNTPQSPLSHRAAESRARCPLLPRGVCCPGRAGPTACLPPP